jgi:hypothetical protein
MQQHSSQAIYVEIRDWLLRTQRASRSPGLLFEQVGRRAPMADSRVRVYADASHAPVLYENGATKDGKTPLGAVRRQGTRRYAPTRFPPLKFGWRADFS